MSEKRSFAFPFVAISRTFAELRDSVFVVLKLEFLGISNDRYFLFARSGFDFRLGKTRRPLLGECVACPRGRSFPAGPHTELCLEDDHASRLYLTAALMVGYAG